MKKNLNPYDKHEVVNSTQSINLTNYQENDINSVLEKIQDEISKRKKALELKGSKVSSATFSYFSFSASLSVKRLETDSEYKARIARNEKLEETKRKKEEEKIKKEFKKLQELQNKYGNFSSAEEALNAKKIENSKSIINIPA